MLPTHQIKEEHSQMLKNASQKGLITGKKLTLFAVVAASAGVLWLGVQNLVGQGEGKQPFVFYTVKKSDLPIVVTERGSLDSQVETKVICQVENSSSDRSGNVGTQIIFIVPNGSPVKEGDLLVEFDSASIRDRLDTQVLAYQKAISAKTQAESKYQNQLLQNETALKEAELAVQLAELEREMYVDPTSGTFQLAVEEIERQIDEAKNSVLESRSALELAQVDYTGMKQLFELGYRGKSDLRQSRLKLLQAEDRLASSFNQIKTYQSNRTKLTNYERKMQLLQLDGAVQTAKRNLVQVSNDNESSAAQALAAKVEAESTEQKELERLERYEAQLENSKIFAPHDGMVVYARPDRRGGGEIMEGAIVRERQEICTLPDMSLMEVKTQVHEAVLDQIRAGLTASVRVDAFPGSIYPAIISKVAVVPSSDGGWFNTSSVKTYETVVKITGKVEDLKPGMTAVVDMHVDRLEGVLSIPVQAVIQVERDTWCYVAAGDGVERRDIKLGRSNDKFVHIVEGLEEGEQVVLNPMDVFNETAETTNEISAEDSAPEGPEGSGSPEADAASPETEGPGGGFGPGAGQPSGAGQPGGGPNGSFGGRGRPGFQGGGPPSFGGGNGPGGDAGANSGRRRPGGQNGGPGGGGEFGGGPSSNGPGSNAPGEFGGGRNGGGRGGFGGGGDGGQRPGAGGGRANRSRPGGGGGESSGQGATE